MTQPPNTGQWPGQRDDPSQYPNQGAAGDQLATYDQPDPYAQQYDAYQQASEAYRPQTQVWPSQQQPLPDPNAEWNNQAPQKSNVPLIIGVVIAVVGVMAAALILFININDDDDTTTASPTTTQSEEGGGSGKSSDDPPGSSGGTGISDELPSDVPIPDGISVFDVYGGGGYWIASFSTSDPSSVYDDWKASLEEAGYIISSDTASGGDFSFIATNDDYQFTAYYISGTGGIALEQL